MFKIHSYLYSFIPFCLILILNSLLVYHLYQVKKSIKNLNQSALLKNQFSISITILAMSFLFVLSTSPGAVISQFFSILIQTETGTIVLYIGDNITFSYHALTIVILMVSNKEFYRLIINRSIEPQNTASITSINNKY